jgi:hypothetical protein
MSAVEGWALVVYQGRGPGDLHVGGVMACGGVPAGSDGRAGELDELESFLIADISPAWLQR